MVTPTAQEEDVDPRSDEKLVEAYRKGESDAFRLLVERYHDDLLRFLVRLGGDRQLAEDAFQDAFLQVHISLGSFDSSRRFRPWLFTIAANKARDLLRKKGRRHTLDLSAPIGSAGGGSGNDGASFIDLLEIEVPPPETGLLNEERSDMVQRALDQLSDPLREILLLAYFQRLTYAQVAEDLGIPLGTVKSRLHAAVATFAKRWKEVSAKTDESESNANE
ncbi:RNA polymerase sigma-54 factor RpoN [hydrothermal vent metagenome]|uniref:RNA polymerase sigma-54 factor RpoN n=1 Tax=hydrothermal vent metagenome TaxID=652676 RepID=A0A3B1DYW5_9ZZZZ